MAQKIESQKSKPKYLCFDSRECTWTSGPVEFGGVVCIRITEDIEYDAVAARKIVVEASSAKEAVEKIINEYECIAVHP